MVVLGTLSYDISALHLQAWKQEKGGVEAA